MCFVESSCHLVNRIVVFQESGAFSSLAKLLQCPYCSDGIDFDSICKRNPSSVFSLKRDHDYYQVRQQILGFIRVLKTLENLWISGVQFQGLESTWNWFLVLESPWIFIEQDWKVSILISFKVNEGHWKLMFRYTEYKILKMLTKCVNTLVFCSWCPVVTHTRPLSNYCRAMFAHVCFQALVHFCMWPCFCSVGGSYR